MNRFRPNTAYFGQLRFGIISHPFIDIRQLDIPFFDTQPFGWVKLYQTVSPLVIGCLLNWWNLNLKIYFPYQHL